MQNATILSTAQKYISIFHVQRIREVKITGRLVYIATSRHKTSAWTHHSGYVIRRESDRRQAVDGHNDDEDEYLDERDEIAEVRPVRK